MSTQLEQSRTKSIERMKEVNLQDLIQKMTDYFEVVDYGEVEVNPEQKARIAVENKRAAGQLDELNQLIAA